jgi:hypothetical protein
VGGWIGRCLVLWCGGVIVVARGREREAEGAVVGGGGKGEGIADYVVEVDVF